MGNLDHKKCSTFRPNVLKKATPFNLKGNSCDTAKRLNINTETTKNATTKENKQ